VELPAGVSPLARRLAAGFVLLAELRAVEPGDDPLPYTAAFAAAWCGVEHSPATVKRAMAELRASGWLVPAGPSAPGVGLPYLPPAGVGGDAHTWIVADRVEDAVDDELLAVAVLAGEPGAQRVELVARVAAHGHDPRAADEH